MATFPDAISDALAYHLERAAGLAAMGRHDEAAPEVLLAWGLYRRVDGGDGAASHADLPAPGEVAGPAAAQALRTARDLALGLTAHFVSEQHHELATIYQEVATAFERDAAEV
jgi:hypothetical protein